MNCPPLIQSLQPGGKLHDINMAAEYPSVEGGRESMIPKSDILLPDPANEANSHANHAKIFRHLALELLSYHMVIGECWLTERIKITLGSLMILLHPTFLYILGKN